MCRGSNLGVCCAQDCEERIPCQDTGGYCWKHNPYDISWDDDDESGEPTPDPVDDPEKRRTYDLSRLASAITRTEASIRADEASLAKMRRRVGELAG